MAAGATWVVVKLAIAKAETGVGLANLGFEKVGFLSGGQRVEVELSCLVNALAAMFVKFCDEFGGEL